MRIDSTGNVGIGTTIPGAKLDVNGEVRVGLLRNRGDSTHFGNLNLYDGSGDTVFDRDWSSGESNFVVKHAGTTQIIIKENQFIFI